MKLSLDEKKQNKVFWAAFVTLLLVFLCYLLYGSTKKEFWYDEMAMVGFVCGDTTLPELLHTYLTYEASNLPLYAVLLWPFYHYLPAYETCLLLLSIVLTLGGTLFLGLFARKRYGRIAALMIVVLSICSKTVCNRIGLELRAYSLMYFGAAMTLYLLLLLHEKATKTRYVFTTIAMLFLLFSHYFGVLLFALLGAGGVLLVFLKKKKIRFLIPFFVSGGLFVPWFVATRLMTSVTAENFWIPRPAFRDLAETVAYLLGGNLLLTVCFGAAWILLLVMVVKDRRWLSVETALLTVPVLLLGVVFVYSRYLSRGGGLYENRYFIAALPMLLLTIAAAVQKSLQWNSDKKWLLIIPGLVLVAALAWGADRARIDMVCQMRDASDPSHYMITQGDADDADVRIVALSYDIIGDYRARGWGDFYLVRQSGILQEITYTMRAWQDERFAQFAKEGVRRIYLMADKDFYDYEGMDYRVTEPEGVSRLLVFDRVTPAD